MIRESINVRNYIFQNKIEELLNKYDSDYPSLKGILDVTPYDFGFEIYYRNGTTINRTVEGITKQIFSIESSAEYIDLNGKTSFIKIYTSIW